MLSGGSSKKVHVLQTGCPVKVQHKKELRKEFGDYTLPVYPINRELYHKLLRNKSQLMPAGLKQYNKHGVTGEDIWKGLPIDGKNYYVTLDNQGNVCFPGQQSWSANQLDAAIESAESHNRSDVQSIIDVAEKLIQRTDKDDAINSRVSTLLAKLKHLLNERSGRRRSIPAPEQEMLTDTRDAFMAKLSTGANKTAGCAPVLGKEAGYGPKLPGLKEKAPDS